MTLQEETLWKGKSVHPTLQTLSRAADGTSLPTYQMAFISDSGNTYVLGEGEREGEKKTEKKKCKELRLIWFTLGLVFVVSNVSVQQPQVAGRAKTNSFPIPVSSQGFGNAFLF